MNWIILICCLAATRFVREDNSFLPFLVVFPIAVTILKNLRGRKELFSPDVFFAGYYLLWMGGGYLVSFYRRSAGHHPNFSQLAFLILLAYFFWMIGLHFPKFKFFRLPHRVRKTGDIYPGRSGYNRTMRFCLAILVFGLASSAVFYLGGALRILLGGAIEETRVIMIFGRGYLFFLARSINTVVPIYVGLKWYFRKKLDVFDYTLLLISILLIALPFSRRPILWFFITMIMLFHYLKKRISFRKALTGAIAIFLIAIIMLQIRSPGRAFKTRCLHEMSVHVENIVLYLRNLEEIGRQGAAPFLMNLKMLLPGHQIDFGLWLKQKLGLTFLGGGISVTLIGEGMMGNRLFGVAFEAFLIGYILKLAYRKLSGRFSLRDLFIYMILLYKASEAINYGVAMVLISALYEIGLVIIIIPAYLCRERDKDEIFAG